MTITRQLVPESTIEEFAEKHGLTMEVHERGQHRRAGTERFYAHFTRSDTTDGYMLRGEFGNGESEAEAIADYAYRISEQRLVIDAGDAAKRKEIHVPRLHPAKRLSTPETVELKD